MVSCKRKTEGEPKSLLALCSPFVAELRKRHWGKGTGTAAVSHHISRGSPQGGSQGVGSFLKEKREETME